MKLCSLMENTPYAPGFAAEHGLSLYVETKHHKLLFDTGQTGAFADNAERLGIDLAVVDLAVLSHGHYDHGGGLKRFLELNRRAPVYVSRFAFGDYYHGRHRYIGLDPSLSAGSRLIQTGGELVIDEELTLYSCNGREPVVSVDSAGLTVKMGEGFLPDPFAHEQYLVSLRIEHAKNLLLSGEVNVTEAARLSGFDDLFYFSTLFKKKTGLTPTQMMGKG